MVKNQKKPLVAASRDELLCVALPVIHRLFGVFILQKENQVLGSVSYTHLTLPTKRIV